MPWPWKPRPPDGRKAPDPASGQPSGDPLSALEAVSRTLGVASAAYGWWPEGCWSPLLGTRGDPASVLRLPASLETSEEMSWVSTSRSLRTVLFEELRGTTVHRRARALVPLFHRGQQVGLLVLEREHRAFEAREIEPHAPLFEHLACQVATFRADQELMRSHRTLRWLAAIGESAPGASLDATLARALQDLLRASWVMVLHRESFQISAREPTWMELLEDMADHPDAWPRLLGPDAGPRRWSGDDPDLSEDERHRLESLGPTQEVLRLASRQGRILVGWISARPLQDASRDHVHEVIRSWEVATRAGLAEGHDAWGAMRDAREREALEEAARARGAIARLQGATVAVEEALRDLASQVELPASIRQRLAALVGPLHVLRGKLDEQPDPGACCRIQDVMKGLQAPVMQLAQLHQVQLATEFETDVTLPVDAERAMFLLSVLLDNGIRFSRPGGRVRLWVIRGESHVRVMVSDSGIGIPAACQPRIGERGYQVDPSRGGAGMSLARLREVLQRVGGTIGFSSREGSGTTFHVTLPLTATREFHASHPS